MDSDLNQESKYGTRQQWLKSVAFFASFFTYGLTKGTYGPTILDFVGVYESTLKVISYMFLVTAIASVCSAFATGFLFDKKPNIRYFALFIVHTVWSISTILRPIMDNVTAFFVVTFFTGVAQGVIVNGVNVLAIEIWRGRTDKLGNGIYHGVHFSFSVGIVLGPVLSLPFLATESQPSRIRDLYITLGIVQLIVGMAFLYFSRNSAVEPQEEGSIRPSENTTKPGPSPTMSGYAFIGIIITWYMVYISLEGTMFDYLTVFGVASELGLSTAQGAKITSVGSFCFATTRLISMFAAVKLKPFTIIMTCLIFMLAYAIPLSISAGSNYHVFYLGVVGMGIGRGPLYAAIMTWLEQHTPANNKIMGAVTVALNVGAMILPLILGQTVIAMPMTVMYSVLACVILLSVIFVISYIIVKFASPLLHTNT